VIVADTSAMVALIDSSDRYHSVLAEAWEMAPEEWVLPWVILPEVDYIVSTRVGHDAAHVFRADVAAGAFVLEWGTPSDLLRANEIDWTYRALGLGLVDTVVMAVAERLEARAVATLDLRDFAAIELKGRPALWPRDLSLST